MTMFIIYILCGITWGTVFCIIGTQKGRFITKELTKYPEHLRSKMLPLMLVGAVLFEAVAWPIDVPIMIYKILVKRI